jgi:uncharacterized membrane protein
MATKQQNKLQHLPRPVRIVRARPRLFLSVLIGLIVTAALPAEWALTTRILVGWDVCLALYLAAALALMAGADIHQIRRQSALADEGRFGILVLTVVAALASLAAIIIELGGGGGGHDPVRLALATVTIVLSWFFIHTMFALHYAHEFHAAHRKNGGGGLAFPGEEEPDYWDFMYFSFVIGMTSQVSDVAISARSIRRIATAHGIVSFLFNATLVALTVNIAASAL